MKKVSGNQMALIVILLAVAVVFGLKALKNSPIRQTITHQVKVKGDDEAHVLIKEFIDFQCPACGVGAKYLKQYMTENSTMVRLELKYFPLPMHSHAFMAAQYAECVAQEGKFWEFHDLLIERQTQWGQMIDAKPAFNLMAKELGMTQGNLDRCLADSKISAIINNDIQEGKSLGVKSTPTYFINGQMHVGPKALETELKKFIYETAN